MFTINSFSTFLKCISVFALFLYISFKIFNYIYTWNYCDYWSSTVLENSLDDITETRKCVSSLVCEIGDIDLTQWTADNQKIKTFSCIRKYESWVWNW